LILIFAAFAIRMVNGTGFHPQDILLIMSEGLAIILILIRRPGTVETKPLPLFAALAGTSFPLFISPNGLDVIGSTMAAAIMTAGLAVNVSAKLALRRSFGIVAANRGIKIGGPYRIVRHPMYLGYMITQIGFLLSSLSIWNVAVYVLGWSFQLARIAAEERVLILDDAYRGYCGRVRYRLCPGLF
jgi:protein-S-isoprenylcysteine O-methyltransferase Ste14